MVENRIIVIGDIHGCSKTFARMLWDVLKIRKSDKIILLGDYIDRGPNPKEVVDIIINLIDKGYEIIPLMGNHESLMLNSENSTGELLNWLQNNADTTLKSFKIRRFDDLDEKYKSFFNNLRYYYILDNFVTVHAGLNFDIDNPFSDSNSMVWLRYYDTKREKIGGRRLIVGHTPGTLATIQQSLKTDNILIDGGCVYSNQYSKFGYLVALEINSMELFAQRNIEPE